MFSAIVFVYLNIFCFAICEISLYNQKVNLKKSLHIKRSVIGLFVLINRSTFSSPFIMMSSALWASDSSSGENMVWSSQAGRWSRPRHRAFKSISRCSYSSSPTSNFCFSCSLLLFPSSSYSKHPYFCLFFLYLLIIAK